jgi:dTDP-glucose 4,6-dehydratase
VTRVYIAGYRGFIGGHLIDYVKKNTDWEITNVSGIQPNRVNYVVHLAGHSEMDRSIEDSSLIQRDISTTLSLLDWAKTQTQLEKFLYFSSDEVFGPRGGHLHFEPWARYNSHSPYAAGKAACEEMCLAWASTYDVPTVVTHCQNLIGERQSPKKFLPTVLRCALTGKPVPLYADGDTVAQRNFLHVQDACAAIVLLLQKGKVREKYNIASRFSVSSRDLVEIVSKILHMKIKIEMRPIWEVRKGFFVDHGINGDELSYLGWKRMPPMRTLKKTIRWMIRPENRHWLGL